jgi:hypothetical protein
LATKVYQQAAPQGDPSQAQAGGFDGSDYQQATDNNDDDGVIDADFTEEK